jgi:hypothetical protein
MVNANERGTQRRNQNKVVSPPNAMYCGGVGLSAASTRSRAASSGGIAVLVWLPYSRPRTFARNRSYNEPGGTSSPTSPLTAMFDRTEPNATSSTRTPSGRSSMSSVSESEFVAALLELYVPAKAVALEDVSVARHFVHRERALTCNRQQSQC